MRRAAACVFFACLAAQPILAVSDQQPNIVLILADDKS